MKDHNDVVEEIFKDIYQILADADIKHEVAPEEGNPVVNDIYNVVSLVHSYFKKKYKGGATDERAD